jgi:hypothetical protein
MVTLYIHRSRLGDSHRLTEGLLAVRGFAANRTQRDTPAAASPRDQLLYDFLNSTITGNIKDCSSYSSDLSFFQLCSVADLFRQQPSALAVTYIRSFDDCDSFGFTFDYLYDLPAQAFGSATNLQRPAENPDLGYRGFSPTARKDAVL